jgi:hypothetical protein
MCCNDTAPRARGKLSTIPVDNSADKFQGTGNFCWIRLLSPICLIFRQFNKALILFEKIMNNMQNTEIISIFVTFG